VAGAVALIVIGLVGVVVAVRALTSGEVTAVWSRVGGWASLSSTFSRDESPVLFWAATLFYGVAGLGLAIFGLVRLLSR
jgi:hypothetical protein